jgi:hypothetical protein
MSCLGERDRNAILLRYFENKSLAEVGLALGISDDPAQKRIARGIEKLRAFLRRRNVAVTSGGLASLISAQAGTAASMRSSEAICAMATGGSNLSTSTAAIVKGTLNMFMTIQLKNAALIALALLITGGAATVSTHPNHARSRGTLGCVLSRHVRMNDGIIHE